MLRTVYNAECSKCSKILNIARNSLFEKYVEGGPPLIKGAYEAEGWEITEDANLCQICKYDNINKLQLLMTIKEAIHGNIR